MARHINTFHKKFLADLRALMRTSYINKNSVPNEETELKIIKPEKPKPSQPERPIERQAERPTSVVHNTHPMDDFEREYQEFIAKLKAKKEQNVKITAEPITEESKPVEVTEPEVIEITEPVVVKEKVRKKRAPRKKKLKTEQIENTEN